MIPEDICLFQMQAKAIDSVWSKRLNAGGKDGYSEAWFRLRIRSRSSDERYFGIRMGPINLIDASTLAQQNLLEASFFGRPFPYGYTGWGPCIRYVEVETRWGLRLRRVRVCR